MGVEVRQFGPECLARYERVSIAFHVESVFRVEDADGGLVGLRLVEQPVAEPYGIDYDERKQERPSRWPQRFDTSRWGFFLAVDGAETVGAAAVAWRSANLWLLGGGDDLAALWDIRVAPRRRGQGVGTALFERAADYARRLGCRGLKIETQNINVLACRFYAARGCRLGCIDRHGYAGVAGAADEVMLLWYLDL